MTKKDAAMFPIYGSLVLITLYLSYKLIPDLYIDIVFSIYFAFLGLICVASLLEYPLSRIAPKVQNF